MNYKHAARGQAATLLPAEWQCPDWAALCLSYGSFVQVVAILAQCSNGQAGLEAAFSCGVFERPVRVDLANLFHQTPRQPARAMTGARIR